VTHLENSRPLAPFIVRTLALLAALSSGGLRAQTLAGNAPPPPVAPAVITRDAAGQATVRAIKLAAPLTVDGRLDEEIYRREQQFGGLIQVVPRYGQEMTERSDVWITYDDNYIYLSCRCWDSAPPDQWIANELRRDTGGLRNNDHIGVMFDTFNDRRSGFAFYTNPLGARADGAQCPQSGVGRAQRVHYRRRVHDVDREPEPQHHVYGADGARRGSRGDPAQATGAVVKRSLGGTRAQSAPCRGVARPYSGFHRLATPRRTMDVWIGLASPGT
jgi:hypothetical protein